jgi:hypothetical protein
VGCSKNLLASTFTRLAVVAVAGLALFSASPAEAKSDSGAFAVTFNPVMRPDGTFTGGTTYSGKQDRAVSPVGRFALVRGQYIEFVVDLATFEVINYTMTGKAAPTDITRRTRTVVFASKFPEHGKVLAGNVTLNLNNEQLVLQRSGPGITMKIQAKDATQGGLFQMEPSRTITYLHHLNPGFGYFFDARGRLLFTNHVFIGRESPELATLVTVSDDGTASRWLVQAGGRMGAVFGEDATQ